MLGTSNDGKGLEGQEGSEGLSCPGADGEPVTCMQCGSDNVELVAAGDYIGGGDYSGLHNSWSLFLCKDCGEFSDY